LAEFVPYRAARWISLEHGDYGGEMRYRSPLIVGALCLAFSLSACATPEAGAGAGVDEPVASDDVAVASESPSPSPTADAAALAQAQAWLDAAVLPPNAVRSEDSVGSFNSFTGWPCGPVEELEGFWTIADATVSDTANWLMEHPTADLTTTAFAPVPDDPAYDSATVGYVPEPDAQEGIVYTIAKFDGGVAVRAEIAAQTESAVCPELPDGATYGAPGQG
jgi:hypothetical protein